MECKKGLMKRCFVTGTYFYREALNESMVGYAYCQVIFDSSNNLIDLICLNINKKYTDYRPE